MLKRTAKLINGRSENESAGEININIGVTISARIDIK
jgi:hypothetical protein